MNLARLPVVGSALHSRVKRRAARQALRAVQHGEPGAALEAVTRFLAIDDVAAAQEAGIIARYVHARNGGNRYHGLPFPLQRGAPRAEVSEVVGLETFETRAFPVIDRQLPFLHPLADGTTLNRPGIRLWTIPEATVLFARGAFIVKDADAVTVAECSGPGSGPLEDLFGTVARHKKPIRVRGRGLLVADHSDSTNYCQWTLNQLTRLGLYERAGSTPGHVLIDSAAGPFHARSLADVAALTESIVEMHDSPYVRVDELHVVTNVGIDYRHPAHRGAPWALDFLDARIGADETEPRQRRIYVSRSDAARRRILNEDELEGVLEVHGVETVTLTGRSVDEQAALFRHAETIVAPHGAGLSNLAFSRPPARVLELFPETYGTPAFATVAAARDLDYAALGCRSGAIDEDDHRKDDMIVDVGLVDAWLADGPA